MKNILNKTINNKDLRQIDEAQLPQVAQQLRDFIIGVVVVN
jgi:1-deoxy-D-xylulose-5-phosphate synthase